MKCKVLKIGDHHFEMITIDGKTFNIDRLLPNISKKLIDACVDDKIIEIEWKWGGYVLINDK